MEYYIYWTYKEHKKAIETIKEDFDKVIDEITLTEPIFKQEMYATSKEVCITEYCVRTADKELVVIGYTVQRDLQF